MTEHIVTLTKDAPGYSEDGEMLAGPWCARAVIDGRPYVVRGAVTKWGANRALKKMVKEAHREPTTKRFRL